MEYGLRVGAPMLLWRGRYGGLNPCFNGIWSASKSYVQDNNIMSVLILVLMEYGLRGWGLMPSKKWTNSLNPCFNGIWSASPFGQAGLLSNTRLNPCFNGIWSASFSSLMEGSFFGVLILVLMEYGLRVLRGHLLDEKPIVLILVLMEYGLRGTP